MLASWLVSATVITKWTKWGWWSFPSSSPSSSSGACFSPPSNQRCWLRADVIIITMLRRASDDWWEARPNQWQTPVKCLPWRLRLQCLRWSGSTSLNQPQMSLKHLRSVFNQGLSHLTLFPSITYSNTLLSGAKDGNFTNKGTSLPPSSALMEMFPHVKAFWEVCEMSCYMEAASPEWVPDFNWDLVPFCFGPSRNEPSVTSLSHV